MELLGEDGFTQGCPTMRTWARFEESHNNGFCLPYSMGWQWHMHYHSLETRNQKPQHRDTEPRKVHQRPEPRGVEIVLHRMVQDVPSLTAGGLQKWVPQKQAPNLVLQGAPLSTESDPTCLQKKLLGYCELMQDSADSCKLLQIRAD